MSITRTLHLPYPATEIVYDLDNARASLKSFSRDGWWEDAATKSKLRSFVCFKDRVGTTTVVKANLSRMQRSLMAKLSTGTLPIELETGRYTNVDKLNG